MESQKWPVIYNLIAAVIGALGQWAYKKGGLQIGKIPIYQNFMLLLGIILFCGVMGLFVIAYKLGGKISVVYPFYATTFFWASIIGFVFEREPFRWSLLFGPIFIFFGIYLIARDIQI